MRMNLAMFQHAPCLSRPTAGQKRQLSAGAQGKLFFLPSDLFANILRGPSAQARPRPSPGPHKGGQGSPQKSKAGKASLDVRAAGRLAAASCAQGGGWAEAICAQEVAKLRWLPVDVGSAVEWQREQRGCEGLGCSEAEGSRPALDACSYTRAAQQKVVRSVRGSAPEAE